MRDRTADRRLPRRHPRCDVTPQRAVIFVPFQDVAESPIPLAPGLDRSGGDRVDPDPSGPMSMARYLTLAPAPPGDPSHCNAGSPSRRRNRQVSSEPPWASWLRTAGNRDERISRDVHGQQEIVEAVRQEARSSFCRKSRSRGRGSRSSAARLSISKAHRDWPCRDVAFDQKSARAARRAGRPFFHRLALIEKASSAPCSASFCAIPQASDGRWRAMIRPRFPP